VHGEEHGRQRLCNRRDRVRLSSRRSRIWW
jgi:hypothetical protein